MDSKTVREDFAAIDQNITALLSTADSTMTKLAADEDDMVEDVEALGQAFLSTVTNLQKLFDTQVTRLEEERTAQSPSGAMYGHEMDALLALQATDAVRGRVDGALLGAAGAGTEAADKESESAMEQ